MTPLSPHQEEALKRFDEFWKDIRIELGYTYDMMDEMVKMKAGFSFTEDMLPKHPDYGKELRELFISEISAAEARTLERAKEAVEKLPLTGVGVKNINKDSALDAIEGVGKPPSA